VVERTFAWIFKNRRLVRDYEQLTAVAETLITIAASATPAAPLDMTRCTSQTRS